MWTLVPNSPYGLCGPKATLKKKKKTVKARVQELVSVKVEVDVLGSPSLTVITVSVEVKQH